jgi:hypothetical protein
MLHKGGRGSRECRSCVSAREAYPRCVEHITVAQGGNRRWAETARRPVGLVELADDPEDRGRPAQQDRQRRAYLGQHDGGVTIFLMRTWSVTKVLDGNLARYELETGKMQRRSRAGSPPRSAIPARPARGLPEGRSAWLRAKLGGPYLGLKRPSPSRLGSPYPEGVESRLWPPERPRWRALPPTQSETRAIRLSGWT